MPRWSERPHKRRRNWRDGLLLVFGIGVVGHQEFFTSTERPYLLVTGLLCMGLSASLNDALQLLNQIRGGPPPSPSQPEPPEGP